MGKFILVVSLILCSLHAFGSLDHLSDLDKAIAESEKSVKAKEIQIAKLRNIYANAINQDTKLEILDNLYLEYLNFRYDSAMYYVEKGIELARLYNNEEYLSLSTIRRALLNARGGYYVEAQKALDSIPTTGLDRRLLEEYHTASFWLYLYLGEYSNNLEMYPKYVDKMRNHLSEAVANTEPGSVNSIFMLAEKMKIADNDKDGALENYMKVIKNAHVNSKLYASSAYSIAEHYKLTGNFDLYEEWLVKAAISDRITPLKENLAIQELAVYLFENNKTDIERVMKYLNVAMEDAIFFGNRLRIIEISQKLPEIQNLYLQEIHRKSMRIIYGSIILLILSISLLSALVYIKKQKNRLSRQNNLMSSQHIELVRLNKKMNELISQLKSANDKISVTNRELHDINKKREWLAKISFSLCAKSIDKLKSYSTIVKRKIKAHQENDLLQSSSLSNISEEDAKDFLQNFDKAFLDLYPTFIPELNSLLLPEEQLIQKQSNSLNTELRICALIRLGIKENTEIASLLFSSIQTIYNNRSRLKNRAIDKNSFEKSISSLCIPDAY